MDEATGLYNGLDCSAERTAVLRLFKRRWFWLTAILFLSLIPTSAVLTAYFQSSSAEADFERIEMGMTYAQVESLLGFDFSIHQFPGRQVRKWPRSPPAVIGVIFDQNGVVVYKSIGDPGVWAKLRWYYETLADKLGFWRVRFVGIGGLALVY